MNALVAGTMLRGMFEDRIQNVLREVRERPNYLLFIDEAHTMVGAGSALGAPSDAANVFKSVLARGEVRIIGATTRSEYKQHIAEDEALARRFRLRHDSRARARRSAHDPAATACRDSSRTTPCEIQDDAIEMALDAVRPLPAPPSSSRQGDRLARYRRGPRGDWQAAAKVDAGDVVAVVADDARIPEDMVFRDVGGRFRDLEVRARQARRSVSAKRFAPSRGA